MLRTILLSTLAAATLAGCATGYSYRNGNGGDYYYGQPRAEYRYYEPYGYYGSYGYGRYAPGYYYDRYGRLVYGYPYGYYGYPYGAGNGWYPRPPRDHGGHDHDGDGDHDADSTDRPDRKPPWRDFGRVPRTAGDAGDDMRQRRQSSPMTMPAPQRERSAAPAMPRMRSADDSGGSRMGRVIRKAQGSAAADD